MTPFQIEILLHYATTRGDHPLMSNPPPIWRGTIDSFLADGLLANGGENADAAYVATDRLQAYAKALQRVPLPVQVWVTPNDQGEAPTTAPRKDEDATE